VGSWDQKPCHRQPLFPESQLRATVQLNDGDLLDPDETPDSPDSLKRLYASRGFIDLFVEPEFDIDDAKQEIGLRLVLDEQ